MAYERNNFKTGQVLTADALNHMEDGIARAMEGGGVTATTYAELKALRDAGQLKAGAFYRITDYMTTTTQENTQSAGHQFDVIVLALDGGRLSEKAWAAHHDGDEYFKDNNLSAWQIWYCLDNDENRFEWASPSDGIKRKVALSLYGYSDFTAYRVPASDTEVNGMMLYAWSQGGGPGQMRYSDTLDITSESKVYSSSGDVDDSASFIVDITEVDKGKGVIYRMIDEFNNDIPYDFKNILFFINDEFKYTFGESSDLGGKSVSNSVKPHYSSESKQSLNFIHFGVRGSRNSFGENCHNIQFTVSNNDNIFGNGCNNITLGAYAYDNTFGFNCANIIIDSACSSNTFGANCFNDTVDSGIVGSTLLAGCRNVRLYASDSRKQAGLNSNGETVIKNLFD